MHNAVCFVYPLLAAVINLKIINCPFSNFSIHTGRVSRMFLCWPSFLISNLKTFRIYLRVGSARDGIGVQA